MRRIFVALAALVVALPVLAQGAGFGIFSRTALRAFKSADVNPETAATQGAGFQITTAVFSGDCDLDGTAEDYTDVLMSQVFNIQPDATAAAATRLDSTLHAYEDKWESSFCARSPFSDDLDGDGTAGFRYFVENNWDYTSPDGTTCNPCRFLAYLQSADNSPRASWTFKNSPLTQTTQGVALRIGQTGGEPWIGVGTESPMAHLDVDADPDGDGTNQGGANKTLGGFIRLHSGDGTSGIEGGGFIFEGNASDANEIRITLGGTPTRQVDITIPHAPVTPGALILATVSNQDDGWVAYVGDGSNAATSTAEELCARHGLMARGGGGATLSCSNDVGIGAGSADTLYACNTEHGAATTHAGSTAHHFVAYCRSSSG